MLKNIIFPHYFRGLSQKAYNPFWLAAGPGKSTQTATAIVNGFKANVRAVRSSGGNDRQCKQDVGAMLEGRGKDRRRGQWGQTGERRGIFKTFPSFSLFQSSFEYNFREGGRRGWDERGTVAWQEWGRHRNICLHLQYECVSVSVMLFIACSSHSLSWSFSWLWGETTGKRAGN